MIGGAILIRRLLPFEFLQINGQRLTQVTVEMMPTLPLPLARPAGCLVEREFSRSLADSTVEQQTTTIFALTCCSARVSVSM